MLFYRIYILLLSILFALGTHAKKPSEVESSRNNYTPSTVSIGYTPDTVSMCVNKQIIHLPKIELKKISQEWVSFNLFENFDYLPDLKSIKENIKEMSSLSQVLGINVQDPKYIELYRTAAEWLGTRYKWAGNSKKGVDCSGFTGIILKEVYNKSIDRSSYIIARNLNEEIDVKDLQPGDLVFFSTRGRKSINHVGVYLGERSFIHASIKQGVIVSSLDEQYYSRSFKKAGRI